MPPIMQIHLYSPGQEKEFASLGVRIPRNQSAFEPPRSTGKWSEKIDCNLAEDAQAPDRERGAPHERVLNRERAE